MRKSWLKKGLVFEVILLFVGTSIISCIHGEIETDDNIEKQLKTSVNNLDDWYYLPAYPNYAPSGLPDFSQLQQDDWKDWKGDINFCGAVSLVDILWWFDSQHENNTNGYPGDGNNSYPLVGDYHAPGTPNPGPYSDDHNYNNVNDKQTPWRKYRRNGELIEQIAWYTNRQLNFIRYELLGPLKPLFNALKLLYGIKKWLIDTHLQNNFTVQPIFKPSFSTIKKYLCNNSGIILGISGAGIDSERTSRPFRWGHFVAVAGINPTGYISFSDPYRDIMNPSSDYSEHNNASIVSHDVWQVNFTSPYPRFASWWLPEYFDGALIIGAIIISEKS